MIVPYGSEVVITRWPVSNVVIVVTCVIAYVTLILGRMADGLLEAMVLDGWQPVGLIGYMFLHGGFWHLAFNMLYLWIFGSAVCEKVGSLAYTGLFLGLGVMAGVVHVILDGSTAVGASGAINGMIGFYLVLYPVNRISCFWWFFFRVGTFDLAGFWIILFWFAGDAWGAFTGYDTGTAYWAHLGGFAAGLGLGLLSLKVGWVKMADYDNPTLIDFLKGTHRSSTPTVATLAMHRTRQRQAPPPPSPVRVVAPPPEEPVCFKLICPHCEQHLDVPNELAGTEFPCPTCQGGIQAG